MAALHRPLQKKKQGFRNKEQQWKPTAPMKQQWNNLSKCLSAPSTVVDTILSGVACRTAELGKLLIDTLSLLLEGLT